MLKGVVLKGARGRETAAAQWRTAAAGGRCRGGRWCPRNSCSSIGSETILPRILLSVVADAPAECVKEIARAA